jgi:DNA-binding PadR family transcriptional regulator
VPTVYVTLIRLEEQGLVRSSEHPPAAGRGGRARRVFELTSSGWDALREARAAADRMWHGLVQP